MIDFFLHPQHWPISMWLFVTIAFGIGAALAWVGALGTLSYAIAVKKWYWVVAIVITWPIAGWLLSRQSSQTKWLSPLQLIGVLAMLPWLIIWLNL